MKRIASVLLLLSVALFSGCASVNSPTSQPIEQRAATLRAITSTGGALVLRNNPRYAPATSALSAEIKSALDRDAILSREVISKFILKSVQAHGVGAADAALFVNLGLNIYTIYAGDFRGIPIKVSDPKARAYIQAFADGLDDAASIIPPTTG